jgi:hypothetical protein
MNKVRFDEIEKDISAAREAIQESGTKQQTIDERLTKLLGETQLRPVEIDTADSDFQAVARNNEAAQANIAALIYGLDEITKTFGEEFAAMSQPTFGEQLIGMFSKRKSEEMKSTRVREADIRTNLNELIRKSDLISTILREQLAVVDERLGSTRVGLEKVQERGVEVAREIEEIARQLDEAGPKVAEIDSRLADATGEDRKRIEQERAAAVETYNTLQSRQQEKTAVQQSLERYAAQYANYIESLTKQAAAQRTMIEKLKIDTEQRSVMYEALVESIRTSEQQNIAHRIDDVGRETDAQADAMITQIGISAENRIAGMLESHELFMKRTAEVRKKGEIHNAEFARRFATILEKVNTGKYVE